MSSEWYADPRYCNLYCHQETSAGAEYRRACGDQAGVVRPAGSSYALARQLCRASATTWFD